MSAGEPSLVPSVHGCGALSQQLRGWLSDATAPGTKPPPDDVCCPTESSRRQLTSLLSGKGEEASPHRLGTDTLRVRGCSHRRDHTQRIASLRICPRRNTPSSPGEENDQPRQHE